MIESVGLYYYHARYYDASIGRFIQADSIVQSPYDPQTLNRYAYCRNNPVKFVDPSGHFFSLIIAAVIAISSAVSAAAAAVTAAIYAATFAIWSGVTAALISAGMGWTAACMTGYVASHMLVGGAIGAVMGAIGAAVTGGNIFKGAAYGAFTGAMTAGLTSGLEIMGGEVIAGIAKATMQGRNAYKAYKNDDYFMAIYHGTGAVATSVKVTAQIHYAVHGQSDPIAFADVNENEHITLEEHEGVLHRHDIGADNYDDVVKVISIDGKDEWTFRGDGTLVTNVTNAGSKNIFGPRVAFGVPHMILDVVPYYIFGNGYGDTTNVVIRLYETRKYWA